MEKGCGLLPLPFIRKGPTSYNGRRYTKCSRKLQRLSCSSSGAELSPIGFLSVPTDALNTEVHVNKFSMDYYDSGEVKKYYTDISLIDLNGKEVLRKTISVNDPLHHGGITMYQTDWGISALQGW